jgi:hypothetical protein
LIKQKYILKVATVAVGVPASGVRNILNSVVLMVVMVVEGDM